MAREDRRHNIMEADDDDDTEVVKHVEMPALLWEDTNFQRQTLKALNKMRKNRQFCDVTLRIGKQDIMAHRVVLAAASPYFVELFTRDEEGPTRKEVEGGGIVYELDGGFSKESLDKLIDYAYTSLLKVPGDMLRPVYLAASALRLDRAANECARFMASNMDLTSSLEIRSTPCVASSASNGHLSNQAAAGGAASNGQQLKDVTGHSHINEEDAYEDELPDDGLSQRHGFNLVGCVDDLIASANLEQLQNNREFLALPRVCVEILHPSKEERDTVQARPLCELVLEWAHHKWQDDDAVQVDTFLAKSSLLIMSSDHSLKDCKDVSEGSAMDSDLILDYKKSNQHFEKPNTKKISRRITTVKPAKPREMLYTRHINQEDAARSENADQYCWKVIAAHRLDNKSILGVVSLDARLMILSIVQRINIPATPPVGTMTRSCSSNSLPPGTRSPANVSRPPSLDKDVYIPVALMKHARCAAGVDCFHSKLVVCGGYDRGECLNKVEAYDLATNSWNNLPRMMCKRGRFEITVVDDKTIYAVGGSNGHSEEASVEKYNPEVDKWVQGPSLPVPLSNIGLCNLNGSVYCIGGSYGSTGSRYVFRLEEAVGTWERLANLHVGRFQAAVISFEDRIWAVGGCESWNPLNSLEIYDPSTNTWTMGPPLNSPRRGCGLAVRKGQLIVVGGTDGTQSMCTTEVLDMTENAWHPGPTMTMCRANVGVAMVNDRLWAVGGFTGKTFLNNMEFLDPITDEWTTYLAVDNPEEDEAAEKSSADEVVDEPPPPEEANGNDIH